VFQGGQTTALSGDGTTGFALRVAETATMSVAPMDARSRAKLQGYEGDPCGECGNYTLVRNGTCMKCNTCGGTSGCS
jgi:ribonucleoside-diphosphate reductase alpha chain